jgi:hypothetical protein
MRIDSIRIQNYRSILDSGQLSFAPGFNLVVGANNVGKSSLLSCLAAKFGGEPHKSIHTLSYPDEPLNPNSRVDFTVVASGEETRRLLIKHCNGERFFPWPDVLPLNQSLASEVLARLVGAAEIRYYVSALAGLGNVVPNNWSVTEYPATRLYAPLVRNAQHGMLRVNVNSGDRSIAPVRPDQNVPPGNDVGLVLGQLIAGKIYWFHAERLGLGVGPYGASAELTSDARNLPEVLNILQGNPERFREYCELVTNVFPSIQKISVRPRPAGGNQAEVLVWQVDPALQRDDLAMPLAQCGTGVGQVLAILYVAKTSVEPRTIIIDEPGSFLHPGASRALIGILKGFSQHQYIIATHSPEIISELSGAPVTIVRWGDSKSSFEQASSTAGKVATAALAEVGARLSDVFGFDKVLWVEGQSDAQALKLLLEAIGRPQRRVGILPVRDTGSFQRRRIAEIMGIYRTLSMGEALLPPAVLFLFDRDGRSERDIEDAIRESEGKIRFLPRRMFENYLLSPAAVALLFNEVGAEHGIQVSEETVARWIEENGHRFCDGRQVPETLSQPWLERADGARLLELIFEELSGNRLQYRKTSHTPRLAVLLHQVDPQAATVIVDLVADVIE